MATPLLKKVPSVLGALIMYFSISMHYYLIFIWLLIIKVFSWNIMNTHVHKFIWSPSYVGLNKRLLFYQYQLQLLIQCVDINLKYQCRLQWLTANKSPRWFSCEKTWTRCKNQDAFSAWHRILSETSPDVPISLLGGY